MEQKEIQFQKKRELGEIISDSFLFLKQERVTISRLIVIYVLPFVILYAVGQVYMQRNVLSAIDISDQEMLMKNIGPFYKNLFLFLFFGLFIQSLLIGTFYSYIEAYAKLGKGNFSFTDISSKFFANSLLALAANLVFASISFFGVMMCIIPGIYFANTFSLVVIISIYEKKGISNTFSRSWKLVNSQWWNTLALNLIGIIITWAISMLLSIPTMLMGASDHLLSQTDVSPANFSNLYWVLTGISAAISTILLIILFTFQAFQYFNLEEREKPEIELL